MEDLDVYSEFYPRTPSSMNLISVEESSVDKASRVSKYLAYLGLKYKILVFLDEAKRFDTALYLGLVENVIDLYENIDMLGFFYTYGLVKEESITKLTIKLDQKDLKREEAIEYLKIVTIVNSIYHEHVYRLIGEAHPNRIMPLVLKNPILSIEETLVETYYLSYKIGLKTGKLVENDELRNRVLNAISTMEKNNITEKASFVNRIYHSDLLF